MNNLMAQMQRVKNELDDLAATLDEGSRYHDLSPEDRKLHKFAAKLA